MGVDPPKPLSIDQDEVIEWLNEKWQGEKNCPLCGENNWNIGEQAGKLPLYYRSPVVGGPGYPLVVITCNHCGYTLLFNALFMGLVPSDMESGARPEVNDQEMDSGEKGQNA